MAVLAGKESEDLTFLWQVYAQAARPVMTQ